MKAIGIDLGTTNSLVAVVDGGAPKALADERGRVLLPSVVAYGPSGVEVGYEARAQASARPQDTVSSVKRLMGRTAEELGAEALSTSTLTQEGSRLSVLAGGRAHTPVEVSAEILKVLAARARAALPGEGDGLALVGTTKAEAPLRAVITVPAYFDDAQRQATRQAGRLAGLEVLRLLNEPTAAALAYGLEKRREGRFAVFDLGGGTFDLSLLHLVDGVFEVLATAGDSQLGGDDFDRAVALALLAEAGIAPEAADPGLRRRALMAATQAKHDLTERGETRVNLQISEDRVLETRLSRDRFEALVLPILARVEAPCRQALADAQLRPEALDGVVLVGGSTRSPVVRRFVAHFFGQKPLGDIDPDQVVALGAAIQADLLSAHSELRDAQDVLLLDVTPLSLGLETMGGVVEKILPRATAIPASRAQDFTTFQDGQDGMDIHVLQGERELVEDCRSLARFRLTGIPPRAAGLARVRVTFQVDADGILSVSARELSSGIEQSVVVEQSHGLSEDDVEAMLRASLDHAEEDVKARLLRTARVEADRVMMPIEKALREDADLLEGEEGEILHLAMNELREVMKGDDHLLVQQVTDILDQVSAGFAQRRMVRALQRGLVERKTTVDALAGEVNSVKPVEGAEH